MQKKLNARDWDHVRIVGGLGTSTADGRTIISQEEILQSPGTREAFELGRKIVMAARNRRLATSKQ